jgi:adenylyl cyclase-associated protein
MAPPPPPPGKGPPPPPPRPTAPAAVSTDDAAGALFAEIAALGEGGVRSGLKKAVRGPVNTTAPEAALKPAAGPVVPKAAATAVASGEAKCELTGKKWQIEHQTGQKNLSVEGTMKQSVYIYKCTDSIIKVNGKVNAIVLDSCLKTSCVFDEVMVSTSMCIRLSHSRRLKIGEHFYANSKCLTAHSFFSLILRSELMSSYPHVRRL